MNTFLALADRVRYGTDARPELDWFVLLSVAGVLLAGCLVWNSMLFSAVQNGATLGVAAPSVTVLTADQSSLDTIKETFATRASEQANYLTGGYTFIDPSQ